MTDLPPPPTAPGDGSKLDEEPPEVSDDALFSNFCAQNNITPDDVSWGMRNEIVKLCRLTYENAFAFQWVGLTYNVRVEPEPDYMTAYVREFIDHIMPLESKNRIRFEQKWQEKLEMLVNLYKEKLPEMVKEKEEAADQDKPIGLFVPETSDKKLIIPGRD